jgi:hypothetical protein
MSTIEELIKLQGFNVNEAKPLTVRGQYSRNTNVDLNKTKQSISLLTTELNKFNSDVQESAFNTGAKFSMKQWVNDTAKGFLSNLSPTSIVTNPNYLATKIDLTTNIVTSTIQSTLNQQDVLINQLENNVLSIVEKQNNVKVERDKDGNVVLIPILTDNASKALDNSIKIIDTIITSLEKVNTRISNEKPIKNIDDFVNNLSLKLVIDFANKVISILIIATLIKIQLRKIKDISISALAATSTPPNPPLSQEYAERALITTAEEKLTLQDLGAAKSVISVLESKILFYQSILQEVIAKIKPLLDLIKQIQSQTTTETTSNSQLKELENKLDKLIQDQQQVQDTINRTLLESEFVQTNKPYYAARIIR